MLMCCGKTDIEKGVEDKDTVGGVVKEQAVETVNKVWAGAGTKLSSLQSDDVRNPTQNAVETADKLKVMLDKAGLGGFGDLVEQMYIAVGWAQSFSLFTVPDFIDWPEEWLAWFDWMHPFSFGLDLGLLVPTAPAGLKFMVGLLPPVLVLARIWYLSSGIFAHKSERDAWTRTNVT
eukprot:COSAG03_NODE_12870_length_527_cov_1.077103_1_plen_175_part_11